MGKSIRTLAALFAAGIVLVTAAGCAPKSEEDAAASPAPAAAAGGAAAETAPTQGDTPAAPVMDKPE